jgi:two-component system, chemotaxis family, protein-glutamate methylesterase/glutaminase
MPSKANVVPRNGKRVAGRASNRDIIVVGASAGGVTALQTLVRQFNVDTPASIFIVLHLARDHHSLLPMVLQRHCELKVENAVDGENIRPGRVYVAPPDRHLMIESGHVHLSSAPRENRTRPAINPLFRSAALAYGARVIGVILSGTLDDGTAGLWEVKRQGGVAIVQLPEDAEFNQMPSSAIASVSVDYQVPVSEMGALLVSLMGQPMRSSRRGTEHPMRQATRLTCPDCHGPIERFQFGPITEFKCRVGHAYSSENMLVAHEDAEERALWSAVESLEEGADLVDELHATGKNQTKKRSAMAATTKRKLAKAIRAAMEEAHQSESHRHRTG